MQMSYASWIRFRLWPRAFRARSFFFFRSRSLATVLLACAVFALAGCSADEAPVAREGVLELGDYDFDEDALLDLNGEWEFYWNRLYTREDFADPALAGQLASERVLIQVPSVWNEAKARALLRQSPGAVTENQSVDSRGYGTLRLRIRGDGELQFPEDLRLATRQWGLAYRLYCGGDLILANGEVGRDAGNSRPGRLPVRAALTPACYESGEFIWHMSNFHTALSGPRLPLEMGTALRLNARLFQKDLLAFVLAGVTLVIAVYHLVLWNFQRNARNHWASARWRSSFYSGRVRTTISCNVFWAKTRTTSKC